MASRKKNMVPSKDAHHLSPQRSKGKCLPLHYDNASVLDKQCNKVKQLMSHKSDAEETTEVVEGYGPFPGGPTDTSVLLSYEHHVAAALWGKSKHYGDLKCINHGRSITTWDMTWHSKEDQIHEIIKKSGLASLTTCSYDHANSLLSLLLSRDGNRRPINFTCRLVKCQSLLIISVQHRMDRGSNRDKVTLRRL
ncbi:hypothetical protein Scep_024177 [Stephania cephalantha]|uniref:Uncharacterized protein n=1 Tax=Stephania cephalantha TaxID=152367 RepID=A0AAP0EYX7_9MAGN